MRATDALTHESDHFSRFLHAFQLLCQRAYPESALWPHSGDVNLCLLEENHRTSLFQEFGSALACLALDLEACVANKAPGKCEGEY